MLGRWGKVSSPQMTERFRVPIGPAYQVLHRLEEKGLLERQHRHDLPPFIVPVHKLVSCHPGPDYFAV